MPVTRRRAVPYARAFVQHDPDCPLAWLYFGPFAWDGKKDLNGRTLILPPHEPPQNYDWRVLKGQWVMAHALGDTEPVYRRRLAYELLLSGAKMVNVFLPERMVRQPSLVGGDWEVWDLVRPHERYSRRDS